MRRGDSHNWYKRRRGLPNHIIVDAISTGFALGDLKTLCGARLVQSEKGIWREGTVSGQSLVLDDHACEKCIRAFWKQVKRDEPW